MIGATLSHYRTIRQLGQGGMGEVYLAEDLNLKRQVALKVLPEALRNDPEGLRRFRTEAEAAARLNHPNIAQIYSIEEADGVMFITMEYVDGQPLSVHILPHEGLPLARFFEWFVPLSDALTHAHEHGVTHRDLKPGNIMIRSDGVPKILDFGLARIKRPEPGEVDHDAPTVSMGALKSLTHRGTVLGTPAYMSPEQARGQEVDERTDLFSFGVVLYEALAGRRPFDGEDYVAIISSIVKDEPTPVTALKPEVPRDLGRLVRKCLQKEVGNRCQTAREVRNDLNEVKADVDAGTVLVDARTIPPPPEPAPPKPVPIWRRPRPIALLGVLLALLAALAAWMLKPSPEPPLRKFQLPLEATTGAYNGPVISPDGTMVVYTRGNRLWIRELDTMEPRELPGTEGGERPFWSPDSRSIGYFQDVLGSNPTLRTVGVQSGASAPVCPLPPNWYPRGGAWMPSGDILFSLTPGGDDRMGVVYEVSAQGGTPRVFLQPDSTKGEQGIIYPHVLPDGASLVYAMATTDSAGLLVLHVGDTRTTLIRHPDETLAFPTYVPSGHIVYQRGFSISSGVWAVPFDLSRRKTTGEPFLVAAGGAIPSVSGDGTLVYHLPPPGGGFTLAWVDHNGRVQGSIGQPQDVILTPALSPDGRWVAVSGNERGIGNIWVHDVTRGTKTRLTSDLTFDFQPAWSPAGDRLAFASLRSGNNDIFIRATDGTGTAQPLVTGPLGQAAPHWSRDGRYLIYTQTDPKTNKGDLWYISLAGDRKSVPFLQTPADESLPQFSPDDRYVAYQSDESGRWEVYVKPFPSGEGRWPVSVQGGMFPRWSRKGDELFYVEGDNLMAVPVETRGGFRPGIPQKVFAGAQIGARLTIGNPAIRMYDVAVDGQRFVVVQGRTGAAAVTVVENWARKFEKKR